MKKTAILLLTITILAASSAHAAAYLKWDGVKGSATDAGHEGWIQLESVSLGTSSAAGSNRVQGQLHRHERLRRRTHESQVRSSGGGMGAGKVSVHDISITKATAKDREASAPAISEVVVTKVNVESTRATIVLNGATLQQKLKSMPRGAAGVEIPQLDLSINGGPTWSFYGTHVLYQDIMIPSNAQGGRSRVTSLTVTFSRMTGPMGTPPAAR